MGEEWEYELVEAMCRRFGHPYIKENVNIEGLRSSIKENCDKRKKRILLLKYKQKLSYQEIGVKLSISAGRIGQIIRDIQFKLFNYTLFNEEISLNTPVALLNIPWKMRRVLLRVHCKTIQDVCNKTRIEILKVTYCGPKTLQEIENYLAQYGYSLKQ